MATTVASLRSSLVMPSCPRWMPSSGIGERIGVQPGLQRTRTVVEGLSSLSESVDKTSSSAMVCDMRFIAVAEAHRNTGLDYDNLIKDPNFHTNFFPCEHLWLPQHLITVDRHGQWCSTHLSEGYSHSPVSLPTLTSDPPCPHDINQSLPWLLSTAIASPPHSACRYAATTVS